MAELCSVIAVQLATCCCMYVYFLRATVALGAALPLRRRRGRHECGRRTAPHSVAVAHQCAARDSRARSTGHNSVNVEEHVACRFGATMLIVAPSFFSENGFVCTPSFASQIGCVYDVVEISMISHFAYDIMQAVWTPQLRYHTQGKTPEP